MFKISISLTTDQISTAIDNLPQRERAKIIGKLNRQDTRLRWRSILKDIDHRLKKFPISHQDVLDEIAAYRREKHASRR